MPLAGGLHYEWHGPPDAAPLILSSGLGGSGTYWTPNLSSLAERYHVLLYDHRGTGRSDRALPPRLSVDDMAGDVLALMDALEIERAHFVGHAAGGVIGLALAARAPERIARLVVVNGWTSIDPHFGRCFEARLALLRNSGPRAYLRAQPIFLFPATWISDQDDALDRELEQQLDQFPGSEIMEARIAALQAFSIEDRAETLQTPVLAIAAKDDMLVPDHCTTCGLARIPGSTVALMAWGGHACNVTDPERFNDILLGWLAGGRAWGAE